MTVVRGGPAGLVRRWRSFLLTVLYAALAWDVSSSPFQPWLEPEVWQGLYWATTAVLAVLWVHPTRLVLQSSVLLFPSVSIVRGFAIWWEAGVSPGFWNAATVAVLTSACYNTWSDRLRQAEEEGR